MFPTGVGPELTSVLFFHTHSTKQLPAFAKQDDGRHHCDLAGPARHDRDGLTHGLRLSYFVFMRNSEMKTLTRHHLAVLKALASPVRLAALAYLKDPVANFPPQEDGDLVLDGVCADFLRDKLGIAAATASRHLTLLTDSDLLTATRKKGWTFYRRNEEEIARFTNDLANNL